MKVEALLHLTLLGSAAAFGISPTRPLPLSVARPAVGVRMGWLDNAFANDASLGARKEAGLSKAAGKVTVTWVK